MHTESVENLMTVGQIIAATGMPFHRVHYILRTRGIRPVRRVAGIRVFAPEVVDQVKQAVAEIDGRHRRIVEEA